MPNESAQGESSQPSPAVTATSPNALSRGCSASFSSPSSSSSGWWSRVETVSMGLMTLLSQGGFLYFVGPKWMKATDVLIESGKWLPFVLLSTLMGAVAAPLAFGRVLDAARVVMPFLPGGKKE